MSTLNLVKIILKACGIILLINTSISLLGLLNSIFINQPFSFSTVQISALIIYVVCSYLFLVKTDQVAKWITPNHNEKIEISESKLMHSIIVIFGFASIICGLADVFDINYNKSMSDSGGGESIGFNFQIGNLALIIIGYIILKNRVKYAQRLSSVVDKQNIENDILK